VSLPIKLPLDQLETKWKSQLDPLLENPITQGHLIKGVKLISGTTVINHGLGRKLVGWFLVGLSAQATVWDEQATNPAQATSLVLVSTAVATANIWVF
jgi:hypothetical protein